MRTLSPLFAFATSAKIKIPPISTFKLDPSVIPTEVLITKDDILKFYREMMTVRTMENNCETLFKNNKIKGFCNIYSGQEAIGDGINAALTYDDPLISSFRIHGQAFLRGISIRSIMSELLGKSKGASQGRGGSIYIYNKNTNFYGGHGVIGAQISLGTGLAFALKYQKKKNVAAILFGDGAANQGQLNQCANIAKLWNLPALFICQNNQIAMGTPIERSSMNPNFYTKGDQISGIRIDGNNVFGVREVMKFAKQYSIQKGPLFLQFMTYRYSGHSLTDDGSSYRTPQQVQLKKKQTDPILQLTTIGIQNKLVTHQQLNAIKDQTTALVAKEIELAEKDEEPNAKDVINNVYVDTQNHYIRGKLYEESLFPQGLKY